MDLDAPRNAPNAARVVESPTEVPAVTGFPPGLEGCPLAFDADSPARAASRGRPEAPSEPQEIGPKRRSIAGLRPGLGEVGPVQNTLVVEDSATMRSPTVATLEQMLEAVCRAELLAAGGES